jgi:hypothetical protein
MSRGAQLDDHRRQQVWLVISHGENRILGALRSGSKLECGYQALQIATTSPSAIFTSVICFFKRIFFAQVFVAL